jgi:undecaprenyl-diphosphatase
MTVLQALLLGALQGVSEFLPISSSGHLVILRHMMGIAAIPVLFDVLLHVSTLLVICIVFRDRIYKVLVAVIRFLCRKKKEEDAPNLKLFIALVVATIVTGVVGLGLSFLNVGQYPKIVSGLFIVTAIILIFSRYARGEREYGSIGIREGLITGCAQGIGVLPGISRSGIVISASLGAGICREKAGEFAFLISVPAVLGAFILELRDAGELAAEVTSGALAAGMISSCVVGFISLKLLLRLLRSAKIHLFAFYLIPLGLAGLILL